jgi:hypothetical protein
MLRVGRYPWFLKQRILGEEGHLSNAAAGAISCGCFPKTARKGMYCWLISAKENNFPEMAYQTVKNILEEG